MRTRNLASIVFWSHRNRPSFTMRGRQIASALAAQGRDCRCLVGPAWWSLRHVREALIVCVKSEPADVAVLRARGNRVLWDAIDHEVGSAFGDYDAILCASQFVKRNIDKVCGSALTEVFYHHADPLIAPNTVSPNLLRIAYVGERGNSVLLPGNDQLVRAVDFKRSGWQMRLRAFNGHFSARLDPGKSVVKLANCAFANAAFLTGREPGVVELLGENYPFYLRSLDGPAISESVRRLGDEVGSSVWFQVLDQMAELRTRLGVNSSARQYASLFDRLSG